MREFDLAVVNLHVSLHDTTDGDRQTDGLEDVMAAVEQHLQGERDIVFVGDFSTTPDSDGE